MSTRIVTTPSDMTNDAPGVKRAHTTTQEHTGGDTIEDSVHINGDHVTTDDAVTDSDKASDPIKAETIDEDGDTPSNEITHMSSDNTSSKYSDTSPEVVAHTNGTTNAIPMVMKANTGSDGDTTDVSNTNPTTTSNLTNTDRDRDTVISTSSDVAQQEQTTDTTQTGLPLSTSDDIDHIIESVTTPEVKAAETTHSVGTSTSSIEEKNRRILERFMKRMKKKQHGHRLKLLRPELVKAFIQ